MTPEAHAAHPSPQFAYYRTSPGWKVRNSWWIALCALSLGTFSWLAFLVTGLRTRSRQILFSAGGYLLGLLAVGPATGTGLEYLLLLGVWPGAVVHASILNRKCLVFYAWGREHRALARARRPSPVDSYRPLAGSAQRPEAWTQYPAQTPPPVRIASEPDVQDEVQVIDQPSERAMRRALESKVEDLEAERTREREEIEQLRRALRDARDGLTRLRREPPSTETMRTLEENVDRLTKENAELRALETRRKADADVAAFHDRQLARRPRFVPDGRETVMRRIAHLVSAGTAEAHSVFKAREAQLLERQAATPVTAELQPARSGNVSEGQVSRAMHQAGRETARAPLPQWIDALISSERYALQMSRAGRRAPDPGVVRAALAELDRSGGRSTRTTLVSSLRLSHDRALTTLLAGVRGVLNVDGYEVLAESDDGRMVVLDRDLAMQQFGVSE